MTDIIAKVLREFYSRIISIIPSIVGGPLRKSSDQSLMVDGHRDELAGDNFPYTIMAHFANNERI